MKLYATVSSERASKGQGGNTKLDIELRGEGKRLLGTIEVRPSGASAKVAVHLAPDVEIEVKGNRQKGEPQQGQ